MVKSPTRQPSCPRGSLPAPAAKTVAAGERPIHWPTRLHPRTVRGGGSDTLKALGYEDGQSMSWDEMIKVSDLDPSVHRNHENFVADVRRFSSGANFTSVQDDNTNSAFTNFVGLRRPQHVDILPDARQQPDIDQDVLQRNKPLIW